MTIHAQGGQVLALPRDAEPFQVGVLVMCLFYGLIGSMFYEQLAATPIRRYPEPGGRVFLALLALGALTALLGLVRDTLQGLRLERAGLWLLVCLCAAYSIWTPFAVGFRGLPLMMFLGILVTVPGYVLVRRRTRQIRAAEHPQTAASAARPKEA